MNKVQNKMRKLNKKVVLLIAVTAAVFVLTQVYATWYYTYSGNYKSTGYDNLNPMLSISTLGYGLYAIPFMAYVLLAKRIYIVYSAKIGRIIVYGAYAYFAWLTAWAIFHGSEPFVLASLSMLVAIMAMFALIAILIVMTIVHVSVKRYRSKKRQ